MDVLGNGGKAEECIASLRARERRSGAPYLTNDTFSELEIDSARMLGQGAFARVFRGHWAPAGDVAVKALTRAP